MVPNVRDAAASDARRSQSRRRNWKWCNQIGTLPNNHRLNLFDQVLVGVAMQWWKIFGPWALIGLTDKILAGGASNTSNPSYLPAGQCYCAVRTR